MAVLPPSATPDATRILAARALRAFADGFVAVLLPLHLAEVGLSAVGIGAVTTATLLGSALVTMALGFAANRLPRRRTLLGASALMAATGAAFAGFDSFWPLLVVALVGTLNPSAGEVSAFLPLEHTVLAQSVAPAERTALFARYSFLGAILAAVGSLAAGTVDWLAGVLPRATILDCMFLLYGAIGLASAVIYRTLSPAAEAAIPGKSAPLGPSRRRVYALAALFSLDAFGGGFVVKAILALWLYQRFGLSASEAGSVFFAMGICAAFSHFAAVWIAGRIGLVNTMVFTHMPSSLLLIAAAFAETAWLAVTLLVLRGLLSQMDMPTRSSYVMAVVTPEERPAAASLTSAPRSLAQAGGPILAGIMLAASPFGWPLVVGGVLKLVYDGLLLRAFAREYTPEEAAARAAAKS